MLFYFITSLLITIIGMKLFIIFLTNTRFLKKKKSIDSSIKKDCIKELHKNKKNTLTMGGVVMNLVLFIMTIGYYIMTKEFLWLNMMIILYGIMGFVDDYIKIKKVRDGVTPKEKLLGLTGISFLVVLLLHLTNTMNTTIRIPFINSGLQLNIIVYSALILVILVATTNSFNITDGLDGLALGIAIIVLAFLGIVAWKVENSAILYTILTLAGTCIGTLFYNKHPAKIFIGDTGSLFLGGAIAIIMISLQIPLWILLILIICLWETITVILQLTSLRFRNKKVFKIAPYHHHLEKCGWQETKIVHTFCWITFICCIIGYLGLGHI
ncbi:phospho-N-acetylmuramoyl-pentapeptide-transferase [Natranaerovirga pectinivora]|uniref:Phospho-N-acetylmuramoyl-pentapeptide-transferase n=1 Tax=Natranaerovirga pectinivora TaxID=682400 RepID=A0A4R3MMS7_9FIRM|nr:phospho-N-acetylmuramoyl-pentapeptide-transferase [Natranaerovirga pectinivora]TCT16275.1 phospho-N-acetylmuramoyl-pentapeptide-transferase [Natranaerovirga pectinivora]